MHRDHIDHLEQKGGQRLTSASSPHLASTLKLISPQPVLFNEMLFKQSFANVLELNTTILISIYSCTDEKNLLLAGSSDENFST